MRYPVILLIGVWLCCSCEPDYNFVQQGKASYYGRFFLGKKTANGEKYHIDSMTAAHRHLPLGTHVLVTNLANQKQITVRINDRGPYVKGRIIDLTPRGADSLGFKEKGTTPVEIKALLPQPTADSLLQLLNIATK